MTIYTRLREAGVPAATLSQILNVNPLRFLAFVPRTRRKG